MNINNQPTQPMTGKTFSVGQKRQAVTRPLPEYANQPSQPTVPNNPILPTPPIQRHSNLGRKWFWGFISALVLFALLAFGLSHLFQHEVDSATATTNTTLPTSPPATASAASQTIQVPSSMVPTSQRTFQVGAHPFLTIKAHTGNVSLHAASINSITVSLHQHNSSVLVSGNQLQASQDADHLTLMSDPYVNNLDYDITAPASTQVQVQVNDGSLVISGIRAADLTTVNGGIDISDIYGSVQAQTTNGDITLKAVHGSTSLEDQNGDITLKAVHGSTSLEDQNGSLRLSDVTGALNAVTVSGDVIVRSSHLEGQSSLKTQNGSVRLTAVLKPTGSYHLETTSGDIDLTLPPTAVFQLDAHTNSGSIRNAFGSNRVGTAPRSQISASIVNGSVIVDMADLT